MFFVEDNDVVQALGSVGEALDQSWDGQAWNVDFSNASSSEIPVDANG